MILTVKEAAETVSITFFDNNDLILLCMTFVFVMVHKELRHMRRREMSELTAVEIRSQANTHPEGGVPTNHRPKVLSNTECPSCFRKASMEVFAQKHGEYIFCYSCGYREMSFYSNHSDPPAKSRPGG